MLKRISCSMNGSSHKTEIIFLLMFHYTERKERRKHCFDLLLLSTAFAGKVFDDHI